MFQAGKRQGPPFAAVSAAAYWYLGYRSYLSSTTLVNSGASSAPGKMWGYITAGALVLGIVPYTLLFIQGTNEKLLRKVKEMREVRRLVKEEVSEVEAKEGNQSAHALVDTWGLLNLGRGLLVVASGVLGTWTVLR